MSLMLCRTTLPSSAVPVEDQVSDLVCGVKTTVFCGFEGVEEHVGFIVAPARESIDVLCVFSQRENPHAFAFEKLDHIADWPLTNRPALAQCSGGASGIVHVTQIQ